MITFTTFDALTLEHNLRVDPVNRYGWQRETTTGSQRASGLGTVLSALATRMHRTNSDRVIEKTSAGDAVLTAESPVQGAA